MSNELSGSVLVDDDGDEFLVVAVQDGFLTNSSRAAECVRALQEAFEMPVALFSRNRRGVTAFGAPALRRVILRVNPDDIPWQSMRIPQRSLWDRTTVLSIGDIISMFKGK